MTELSFEGRVAVLTGAGRGVGRAQAVELARRGAAVVVNDIGFEQPEGGATSLGLAQEVVDEIIGAGGRAVANTDDAGDPEAGKRMIQQAIDEFGRVDVVVANAGTSLQVPFGELRFEDFEYTLRTHLYSSFHAIRAAWPHFQRQQYGRVVLTTSGVGMFGMLNSASYGTAKAGIYGLTRALALEGEAHGIKANAFWPSAFTRMVRGSEDLVRRMRAGMPVELAIPVAIWMAHESCSVTGETLHGGSGRISRVVVAETMGVHKPDMRAEDVADFLSDILDPEGQQVFRSALESSQFQSKLTGIT
jgi:NAD(P)-dependent dehydrogenase (short-subunit alcohol dehydrogenase family)